MVLQHLPGNSHQCRQPPPGHDSSQFSRPVGIGGRAQHRRCGARQRRRAARRDSGTAAGHTGNPNSTSWFAAALAGRHGPGTWQTRQSPAGSSTCAAMISYAARLSGRTRLSCNLIGAYPSPEGGGRAVRHRREGDSRRGPRARPARCRGMRCRVSAPLDRKPKGYAQRRRAGVRSQRVRRGRQSGSRSPGRHPSRCVSRSARSRAGVGMPPSQPTPVLPSAANYLQ